jgi:signal transduction histidine kinase
MLIGGTLGVESRPGSGTMLYVWLPADDALGCGSHGRDVWG